MKRRTLLTGGHVLTMDPALGTLPTGDVLLEGERIAAVGTSLPVVDAEVVDVRGRIVAPGMIDTHRHTWQSLVRGLCTDWTLADYFYGVRLAVSPAYTAEDVHLGNRLGAVEALDAGVTTILDFSHCNNTPDHADAAVTGLRDAGIRAAFCYGFFESNPLAPPHFAAHEQRVADFERIADAYFAADGGLLTLGVALTELGVVPFSHTRAEIEVARRREALIATHMACVWGMPSGFDELATAGLLGPDQVHIHCNTLTDAQWTVLAASGAKVSISVETELNMGMGRPVFGACAAHGVLPTLSCDVVSLNSGDLVSQIRQGLGFTRWAETEALNLRGRDPRVVTTTAAQALEWSTVNAADALGMSERIGSISPGKQADLIVVGGPGIGQHPALDAAGTMVFQTTPADVRDVLVAGRFVKRDGRLIDHDLPDLLGRADAAAARILRRVQDAVPSFPGTPEDGFELNAALATANLRA
ncbi:amidohydrolase family protein [Pseudonocardia spinosispora]|uniref:amidohydrolase family protein n=1 Tax=Pseudonocardia spinosispora TaxID=103441 RepID=UPI00040F64BD|nr:amidohydrolase family protein [Pseudonocardia spinosispora]